MGNIDVGQLGASADGPKNFFRDSNFLSNLRDEAHETVRDYESYSNDVGCGVEFGEKVAEGNYAIASARDGGSPSGIVSNWKSGKPLREPGPLELRSRPWLNSVLSKVMWMPLWWRSFANLSMGLCGLGLGLECKPHEASSPLLLQQNPSPLSLTESFSVGKPQIFYVVAVMTSLLKIPYPWFCKS
ncbi:hypothetical protein NE237_017000 [Protea cynaroides]|uniref:Uncharacterized protein n=1 Tax=Protea cynaroides TaxID=273540 RepID=A0A9Q0K786_9MAGN|nr:hypothetical protein NE237_017000 [Protea cynaroides]